MTRLPKYGYPSTPFYYLGRYRTTQRPRPCVRCGHNAYYYHEDWDWVCAAHLLDLVNIGGNAFDWEDYPEVWARTERLLQREAPSSSGAKNTASLYGNNAVEEDMSWDGTSLKALMEDLEHE